MLQEISFKFENQLVSPPIVLLCLVLRQIRIEFQLQHFFTIENKIVIYVHLGIK